MSLYCDKEMKLVYKRNAGFMRVYTYIKYMLPLDE